MLSVANPIISVQNLSVGLKSNAQHTIVENVKIDVEAQSMTAIVGGSGSGKTTVGMAILNLLSQALRITSGKIVYNGKDLLSFSQSQMRCIRGKEISMVWQDPLSAFNPILTLGAQVDEVLGAHTQINSIQRREKTLDLFNLVGLSDPKRVYMSYPYQISGGMRQRVMIAQAIAVNPKLIIADESTSSLDVTLQAKIMELFCKLREELKVTIILISHDIGLVRCFSDYLFVMKDGGVVESGATQKVIKRPKDNYTKQLMKAV